MPRLRVRLLVFAIFLLTFPFFLRRRPRVERRITILAPPETIFPLVNDLRNWPLWTAWSEREEIEFNYGDVVEGAGALQRWRTAKTDGMLRIVRSRANRRIDYTLEMDAGKYHLLGRVDFIPDGACTRIVWKCVWPSARNPYMRYIDLAFRWLMGRDFARGLARLRTAVERKRPLSTERAM